MLLNSCCIVSLVVNWAGIALEQINNRSIQDMHIFGDPSRIPIVLVEQVINAPLRSTSGNSYFNQLDLKDANSSLSEFGSYTRNTSSGVNARGRVLKIVVFVHGFQACPLTPIWKLKLRVVKIIFLPIDACASLFFSWVVTLAKFIDNKIHFSTWFFVCLIKLSRIFWSLSSWCFKLINCVGLCHSKYRGPALIEPVEYYNVVTVSSNGVLRDGHHQFSSRFLFPFSNVERLMSALVWI